MTEQLDPCGCYKRKNEIEESNKKYCEDRRKFENKIRQYYPTFYHKFDNEKITHSLMQHAMSILPEEMYNRCCNYYMSLEVTYNEIIKWEEDRIKNNLPIAGTNDTQ